MFRHDVDIEREVVTVRVDDSDDSASDVAAESVGRLLEDPRVHSGFSMMIVIEPGAEAPDEEELAEIASLLRFVRGRIEGRIAVVATGTGHATPARLISVLSGFSSEVFEDERTAMRWVLSGD